MTDLIRIAIDNGLINERNISFRRLRLLAGSDNNCHIELGRGRAILRSVKHLDQYLSSYGPMTESQWNIFLEQVSIPDDRKLTITDYGCGQGLATALLFDHYGPALRNQVRQIVLVEPSAVALERAKSVLKTYCPGSDVYIVNKKLDDVQQEELRLSPQDTSVHLFSNVLDIEGFDIAAVFNKICQTRGRHIALAVSHNRQFNGGTNRIRTMESEISNQKHAKWVNVKGSYVNKFDCPNSMAAISWYLELEVL